jgi:hypothetical protein
MDKLIWRIAILASLTIISFPIILVVFSPTDDATLRLICFVPILSFFILVSIHRIESYQENRKKAAKMLETQKQIKRQEEEQEKAYFGRIRHLEEIGKMDPIEFEQLVGQLFKQMG